MAITARNPRRARLIVTLAGIALILIGIPVWGTGDIDRGVAEVGIEHNSSSAWGDILGFDSTQDADYAAAMDDKESAESQMTFGIILIVLGAALVGSRWLIRPAPAVTLSKPVGPSAMLTPEQQEQAIAMYLEAQKRQQADPGK